MIKIAIDLGSKMTKIYRADTNNGVVLAEPSCVAIAGTGEDAKVVAVGKEAENLIGRTADYTKIYYPIYEGEIENMSFAVTMLKEFLSRIEIKGRATRRVQVLISVPCGVSDVVFAQYKALAEECNLKKVWFVEQPYLAALGGGAVLDYPVFCLDIGGGVSNAAIVTPDGIIAGLSLNIGGNNIDENIINKLYERHELLIGAATAENIKRDIATLAPMPRGTKVVEGRSLKNQQPASASLNAEEISDCIRVYVDKIVEYARTVLWNLPPEVSGVIKRGGVYLSGGVMNIPYLPQHISRQLGIAQHVSENPQYVTVIGGGVLLQEKELLHRFAKKY